jgi:hypothetical protein
MSTKVSYSDRTVSINVALSFDQMAVIEDVIATAAIEAVENSDAQKTTDLLQVAEVFGIDIDIDSEPAVSLDMGNSETGQV